MNFKRIITAVILISTLLKLYYAYVCSFYIYCDTAIMGLIAKQMLKGEFALFFYGGFYTWTIESWFIALFFFLFGISNYTIYLGPIFVSVFFLITIYFLGREFGNKNVGLLALVYSAFPPFYFFKYNVIPVGYLVEMPLLGNLIFLITFLLIRNKSIYRGFFYFSLLGVLGAAAFWLHFIALYYLVSVAVFMFINMITSRRRGYYIWGGICALVFFFIGGLPCWLFNIKHNFVSFVFSNVNVSHDILYGIKRFLTYQVPGILGNDIPTIIVFMCGLVLLLFKLRLKNLLLLLFFFSMAILFSQGGNFVSSKDFRYIISIFTLIPITLAYFIEWVNNKIRHFGTGIFILLIFINIFNIGNGIIKDKYTFKSEGDTYTKLMSFFAENKIDGIYGAIWDVNTINFLGKDRIYASQIIDSASPFDEKVIGSNRIAFTDTDLNPYAFNPLCGAYREKIINGYTVVYDFKKYNYYGEEIIPNGWKARSNYNTNWAGWAFDRNLDRHWSSISSQKPGMYYEIEFPQVYTIYKFQLFNMPSEFGYRNLLSGFRFFVSLDGREWKLIKEGQACGLFWAGPHVIWRQRDALWEVIFDPVDARFIRIENTESSGHNTPWEINEIIFYKYSGQREFRYRDNVYNVRRLYEYIKNKGIRFVYADYWLSQKIREWSNGSIQSLRIYNNSWPDRPNTDRFVKLDCDTAIIVNRENENAVSHILNGFGLDFRKKHIKDYVCFDFKNQQDRYFLNNLNSLFWIESGISRVNLRGFGELLNEKKCYAMAVKYFPYNLELRYRLLDFYKGNKLWDLYKKEKLFIKHRLTPCFKYHARFDKGIEFLGFDFEQISIAKYRINYYWKLKRHIVDKVFVFVHFIRDGKIIFQNDHPLLEQFVRLPVLNPNEIWKESYIMTIPLSLQGAGYTIKLGLWLPDKGGKRLKILGSKSTSVTIENINISRHRIMDKLKGRIVFESDQSGNKEIYIMNADGSNIKRLTFTNADNGYPNWSPDGKSIVFASKRDGNNEIYIMNGDGQIERRLTDNPTDDVNPSWHPDGKRIIFVSDREGAMNFYLIGADGGGLTKITNFKEGVHDIPRISPDGKEVLFTSNMSLGWQMFKMDIDGGNLQRISNLLKGHCEGIWSHNGDKILFISRFGTGDSSVFIMDKDGGNEQRLTTNSGLNYNPRFSPDDKKIIFSSGRDGNWELYMMDIVDCRLIRITYTDSNEQWSDWAEI